MLFQSSNNSVELSPNDFFRQAQDVTPTQNKKLVEKWQAMEKEARALIETHIEEEQRCSSRKLIEK